MEIFRMSKQNKFKLFFASILVLIFAVGSYWHFFKSGETEVQITDSGIIQKLERVEYACGKYDRYSCNDYFVYMNDRKYEVSENFYMTSFEGENTTIGNTYDVNPGKDFIALAIAIVGGVLIGAFICVVVLEFLNWSINHSNNRTWSEHRKKNLF